MDEPKNIRLKSEGDVKGRSRSRWMGRLLLLLIHAYPAIYCDAAQARMFAQFGKCLAGLLRQLARG